MTTTSLYTIANISISYPTTTTRCTITTLQHFAFLSFSLQQHSFSFQQEETLDEQDDHCGSFVSHQKKVVLAWMSRDLFCMYDKFISQLSQHRVLVVLRQSQP